MVDRNCLFVLVVTTQMELKPNAGSDRAWVWPVPSDFADEEAKQELLAIRFANSESKHQFFFCPHHKMVNGIVLPFSVILLALTFYSLSWQQLNIQL